MLVVVAGLPLVLLSLLLYNRWLQFVAAITAVNVDAGCLVALGCCPHVPTAVCCCAVCCHWSLAMPAVTVVVLLPTVFADCAGCCYWVMTVCLLSVAVVVVVVVWLLLTAVVELLNC